VEWLRGLVERLRAVEAVEAAATGAGGAAFGSSAFIDIARSLPRLHFNMAPAAVKPRPQLRPVGTLRREATFRQRPASIPSTPPTRLVQPDPVFLQRSGFLWEDDMHSGGGFTARSAHPKQSVAPASLGGTGLRQPTPRKA
jgi:hypothetical protein